MATRLEIDIELETCEKALELGVTSVKLKAAGVVGYPDRLFWIPGGRCLIIEFKRPGESPDPVQKVIIRRLRHYGYQVEICDNVAEALQAIKACLAAVALSEKSR